MIYKQREGTYSAPICVTAPQINGEGTETLCMTFLYKKRKITAPKTKRFKRAFPFVLRGLAIFLVFGSGIFLCFNFSQQP